MLPPRKPKRSLVGGNSISLHFLRYTLLLTRIHLVSLATAHDHGNITMCFSFVVVFGSFVRDIDVVFNIRTNCFVFVELSLALRICAVINGIGQKRIRMDTEAIKNSRSTHRNL